MSSKSKPVYKSARREQARREEERRLQPKKGCVTVMHNNTVFFKCPQQVIERLPNGWHYVGHRSLHGMSLTEESFEGPKESMDEALEAIKIVSGLFRYYCDFRTELVH